MPSKRRGFYDQAPVDTGLDLLRERNVEVLMQPLMQPKRTVQRDVPIDRIRPNPFQARRTFTGIDELAQAIRTHGFISRLRVRPDPVDAGYFQMVYGERRWRAAQAAGLTEIPCDLAEHSDEELIEVGLLENVQREDLNPLEEARMLKHLIDQRGYSVRSLAERLGKSKGYVDNRLALLRAPEDVQQMVMMRPDTVASARLIAQLPTPAERQPLIEGLTRGSLAAKDVRDVLEEVAPPQITSDATSDASVTLSKPPSRRPASTAGQALSGERALARATRGLETMITQLEATLPVLAQPQRDSLLDYIVRTHLPRLEQVVEALGHPLPLPPADP